jgi:hypothetical protein
LSNYRLRNEGLDPTLSNDWLKMRGWKQCCRMISYKMRSGTNIVNLLSHFPMISAQLWMGLGWENEYRHGDGDRLGQDHEYNHGEGHRLEQGHSFLFQWNKHNMT